MLKDGTVPVPAALHTGRW